MDDRTYTTEDLARNRTWAALGFLVFFIPLIKCKESPLGRHCANQGLLLLIVVILLKLLFGIFGGVPLIGWLFILVGNLLCLGVGVVGLLCMVQLMSNDRVCTVPVIGEIRLIR